MHTRSNQKQRKSKALPIVVIAAAAAVLIFALVQLTGILGEDAASIRTFESLRSYVSEPETADGSGEVERTVDFEALRQVNEDIVAWILIPGTKIDYPVTLGKDNEYYITHSADKSVNRAGSIFLDMAALPDFTDRNTVVYGHNMNNGTMFAGLHDYENADFFAAHPTVYLFTPDGKKHEYRIFSAHSADAKGTDPAYATGFADDDAFLAFAQDLLQKSLVPNTAAFSPEDKILTLSTCIKGQDDQRFVVHAVKQE